MLPPLSPLALVVTFIRSMLFALLFYGLTVPLMVIAFVVMPLGWRAVARIAEIWSGMHRFLARWVLGQKIRIEGILPADARFIVAKHESMFETLDAPTLFYRPVIAAKRELMEIPGWGRLAHAYGLIAVDREGGASTLRTIRAKAREAFAAGRPVILYAEGTRVAHGSNPPLKAGFAGLYALLDSPVIPLAVDSGRVSPRNSFLKRAGTVTYLVGEPIPTGLPRAEAERRVHEAINALNRRHGSA
jgi:1-acyl-sn-glycerol-3-phosphate acyltransferase